MKFKIFSFLIFIVGISFSMDDKVDPFYYRPDKNKLKSIYNKRNIETLDLSNLSIVNDKFINDYCSSESSLSIINIDLSRTSITKESLKDILNGKIGTKRDFIKFNRKYNFYCSEIFVNITGCNLKDEDIEKFKQPFKTSLSTSYFYEDSNSYASHIKNNGNIDGIKILIISNKEIPLLRNDLPLKFLSYSENLGFSFKKVENKKERSNINTTVIPYENNYENNLDFRLSWFDEIILERDNFRTMLEEYRNQRNNEIAIQMLKEREPDEKILMYSKISKKDLEGLKNIFDGGIDSNLLKFKEINLNEVKPEVEENTRSDYNRSHTTTTTLTSRGHFHEGSVKDKQKVYGLTKTPDNSEGFLRDSSKVVRGNERRMNNSK